METTNSSIEQSINQWIESSKDDVVATELATWTFLPTRNTAIILDNTLIYIN